MQSVPTAAIRAQLLRAENKHTRMQKQSDISEQGMLSAAST